MLSGRLHRRRYLGLAVFLARVATMLVGLPATVDAQPVMVDPVIVPPNQIATAAVMRALGISARIIPVAKLAAKRR